MPWEPFRKLLTKLMAVIAGCYRRQVQIVGRSSEWWNGLKRRVVARTARTALGDGWLVGRAKRTRPPMEAHSADLGALLWICWLRVVVPCPGRARREMGATFTAECCGGETARRA